MSQFPRWKSITVLVALIFGSAVCDAKPVRHRSRGATRRAQLRAHHRHAGAGGRSRSCATSKWPSSTAISRTASSRCASVRRPEQLKARDLISESLADTYIVALTKTPRTPRVLRTLGLRPMNLGLDLRGGLYLLYQVDVEGAVKQVLDRLEQDFRRTLRDERIPYQSVEAGPGGLPSGARTATRTACASCCVMPPTSKRRAPRSRRPIPT